MGLLDKPQIILASASPRRQQLLRQMGLEFTVQPPLGVKELREGKRPDLLVLENARRKAAAVARRNPQALVIGADTEVVLGDRIFGKPRDLAEATAMLEALAGRRHEVFSGICIIHRQLDTELMFCDRTGVWMRPLNRDQIREYFTKVNPLDKAGAYAIQEHGEGIVERIEGSFNTVMGLPVERLQVTLQRFGVLPPAG